jgi:hypothetical protein
MRRQPVKVDNFIPFWQADMFKYPPVCRQPADEIYLHAVLFASQKYQITITPSQNVTLRPKAYL